MIFSIIELKPFIAGLFYENGEYYCYVDKIDSQQNQLIFHFEKSAKALNYFDYDLKIYSTIWNGKYLANYNKIKEFKSYTLLKNEFVELVIKETKEILKIESKPNVLEINENHLAIFYKSKLKYLLTTPNSDIIHKIYVNEKCFDSLVSNNNIIDLSYQNLKYFPISLLSKTKNQKIDICGNQFQYLPKRFSTFSQLKYLDISENLFQGFPEVITKIKSLEHLIIRRNLIDIIPDSIKELSNLKELDLSLCFLRDLPESIVNLNKIEKFVLDSTLISEIPNYISQLETLTEFHITNNKYLEKLPETISNLKNLNYLYLYGNNLKFLPDSIGELKNLKILHLGANNLKNLPPTISMLGSLEKLILSDNKLTEISYDIFDLPNLKYIALNGNQNLKEDEISIELVKRNKQDQINIFIKKFE